MGMSHVNPMFFLILSLFFLPTLLAIPFQNCGRESYPIKVTGVEAFEEQKESSYNITCYTNKVITGGFVYVSVRAGIIKIIQRRFDLSKLITCPVSPGSFVLPIHIPFPTTKVRLRIYIKLVEGPDYDEIMCVYYNTFTRVAFA